MLESSEISKSSTYVISFRNSPAHIQGDYSHLVSKLAPVASETMAGDRIPKAARNFLQIYRDVQDQGPELLGDKPAAGWGALHPTAASDTPPRPAPDRAAPASPAAGPEPDKEMGSAGIRTRQTRRTGHMALARLRLLLLLGLLLRSSPGGAGMETPSMQKPSNVTGYVGQNVTLPCRLRVLEPGIHVSQFTWENQQLEGALQHVATFHHDGRTFSREPRRMRFVAAKAGGNLTDASLMLSDLRVEDGGSYKCSIATFPRGTIVIKTQLLVLASPQNKVEPQQVLPPLRPGEPVPVALCASKRGWPPAKLSWQLDDSALNETIKETQEQKQEPLSGTVNVTSLLLMVPSRSTDGKRVTCRVEHDTLAEPDLLHMTLSVPYPPEVFISGYNEDWYSGQKNATLSCDIHSNPEPVTVDWNTTTGTLPRSAEVQGRKLLFRNVDESINNTMFTCLAINAMGTGQRNETILLKEPQPPREREPSADRTDIFTVLREIGVICGIGIAIGIVIGIVIAGFKVYRPRRRARNQTQSRSSTNGDPVEQDQVPFPVQNTEEDTGDTSGLSDTGGWLTLPTWLRRFQRDQPPSPTRPQAVPLSPRG
nr:poliovirus receptor homolog [Cavia porcellus]